MKRWGKQTYKLKPFEYNRIQYLFKQLNFCKKANSILISFKPNLPGVLAREVTVATHSHPPENKDD